MTIRIPQNAAFPFVFWERTSCPWRSLPPWSRHPAKQREKLHFSPQLKKDHLVNYASVIILERGLKVLK